MCLKRPTGVTYHLRWKVFINLMSIFALACLFLYKSRLLRIHYFTRLLYVCNLKCMFLKLESLGNKMRTLKYQNNENNNKSITITYLCHYYTCWVTCIYLMCLQLKCSTVYHGVLSHINNIVADF